MLPFFQEYILTDVKDRQHLLMMHKKAKKIGLDFNQYNQLKDQIKHVELDLKRLRDPLRLRLPQKAASGKPETAEAPSEPKTPETSSNKA